MTDVLDDLLAMAEAYATGVLVGMKDPELMPIFHMIAGDGHMLCPAVWRDTEEKRATLAGLKAFMRLKRVTAYCFVSEAWTSLQPEGWRPGMPDILPPPSERPDRKEVVIAMAANKKTAKSRSWEIVRGEAGSVVKLNEDKSLDPGIEGAMTRLLR